MWWAAASACIELFHWRFCAITVDALQMQACFSLSIDLVWVWMQGLDKADIISLKWGFGCVAVRLSQNREDATRRLIIILALFVHHTVSETGSIQYTCTVKCFKPWGTDRLFCFCEVVSPLCCTFMMSWKNPGTRLLVHLHALKLQFSCLLKPAYRLCSKIKGSLI